MASLADIGGLALLHPLLQTAAFFLGLTAVYVIMRTLHGHRADRFRMNEDRGVKTHMTLGALYMSTLLFGFLLGPVMAVLAGYSPFQTLHSFIGIAIAGLVVAGGSLGLYLSKGAERVRFIHMTIQLTSLALLAFQAATGIMLLPS